MPATFVIEVSDLDSVLQLYDRIEVWKSADATPTGSYTEITADTPQPAILETPTGGPYTISGQPLSIVLNGADPVVVTFSGTDPIPLTEIIDQLNLAIPSFASPSVLNHLHMQSPIAGTGSSLLVTGTAAVTLGVPSAVAYGKGPRILMGNLNSSYRFVDLAGDDNQYYKFRYYSQLTKAVGAFSDPFRGEVSVILPQSSLAKATVNLIDTTGAPIIGRRIILVPVQAQIVPYNGVNYGLLPSNDRIELTTDGAGHAEVNLVKGTLVRAFFEGSGYAREFVVPDADFDLLTVLSTQPDPFSIIQAPPMPIRES